jgi:OmpA-OmpF porin, OOP family
MQKHTHYIIGFCLGAWLGFTGQAHAASTDARDVVRDDRHSVVVNSYDKCVRTKWNSGDDVCAGVAKAAPVSPQRLTKAERTVYFEFNKATLTPEGKQILDSLATKLKSDRQVKQARIIGYADRIGNTAYNEKLSQKRAMTVRDYLISRGFINARASETRWLGESSPRTQCSDKLSRAELITCLAPDRRVEAEIDYLAEAGK